MKNAQVIENFFKGQPATGSNLKATSDGQLINYTTVIASKKNDMIILNARHYSKTTSIHQNRIRRTVNKFNLKLEEIA